MTRPTGRYAFPHTGAQEATRLDLFEQRLDPLTRRRVERLGLAPGSRCLEIGAGHGSVVRWLCDRVGPAGSVTATDLETDFLDGLGLHNLTVVENDLRTDDLPEGPFDLVHTRAVLMHIPDRMTALERMVSRLAPGGWLLVEEPDFGMWLGDYDPVWALLRQAHGLELTELGADAELDIVQPGTPPEFLGCGFVHIGVWGRRPS